MRSVWWRRNRLWLLAVPLLLALALATSSFRLTRLYVPWEWSRPVQAGGVAGTLDHRFEEPDGVDHDHRVDAKVLEVAPISHLQAPASTGTILRAAPGGQLWRITLLLEADPQVPLRFCHLALEDAAGNVYDVYGSLVEDNGDRYSRGVSPSICTPDYGPGPVWDVLKDVWVPGPSPRPRSWTASDAVVLPAGVKPVAVRVGWHQPDYLRLAVPS